MTLATSHHSAEAELAFLGGILGWPDSDGPDAMELLQPRDFFGDDHRKIFTALASLKLQGRPVNDAVLLLDSLHSEEKSDLGPLISSLLSPLYRGGNLDEYARIIKAKAAVRFQSAVCESMAEKLASANGNAAEIAAEISTLSESLAVPALTRVVVAEAINLPDMPESVLDGRLGEICQKRMRGFPIAFSWLPLLTAAGALVRPTSNTLRTNLYTALVGPPHSGKSQAIDQANFLMDLKPPILEDLKAGSAEGAWKDMGDRGGAAVLLSTDELSHLLEKAQISNASFSYVLNTAFYKDAANLTIARGAKVNFNCRLSLIGGIVDEQFEDSFGGATTGGLYDRFLFGQCPTGCDEYLYRPQEGRAAFEDQLDECPVNREVWEARDEMAKREKLNPRLLELALRSAAICAAFDGRHELRARDLGPAWELARYQNRVRLLLRPNPGKNFEAQIAARIVNYLNRHASDGGWLVLREVLRATRASDYGPSVAERAMQAMTFSGSIEQSSQAVGKGQKRRLVRLPVETPKSAAAPAQIPVSAREIADDEIPF
jgi:DnaB helicase-like protein